MSNSRFANQTLAIFGVGLLGGSLGAAVKQRTLFGRVIGVGRNPARMLAAQAAGLIDEVAADDVAAIAEADVAVFCTPVNEIARQIRQIARRAKPGCVMTDVGSTKAAICRDLFDLADGPSCFVGSHPLAGSEKQGFEAADANLFEHRLCVISPLAGNPASAIETVESLWSLVGMRLKRMSADEHDEAVARTSHVPHLVASALAGCLPPGLRELTASGFRDTTRIASGDPELWTQILLSNSDPVLAGIDEAAEQLDAFRRAIRSQDRRELLRLLELGKTTRDALRPVGE